jgi:hypothetical protein
MEEYIRYIIGPTIYMSVPGLYGTAFIKRASKSPRGDAVLSSTSLIYSRNIS